MQDTSTALPEYKPGYPTNAGYSPLFKFLSACLGIFILLLALAVIALIVYGMIQWMIMRIVVPAAVVICIGTYMFYGSDKMQKSNYDEEADRSGKEDVS